MIALVVLVTFFGTTFMWIGLILFFDSESKEARLARRYQRRLERLERRTLRKIERREHPRR